MIRIKDIARQAGVSPTTVSNVLHGNYKKVSQKTVERIEKLLKETEYVPSMGARMLAEGSSRVIGVLAGEQDGESCHMEGRTFNNILIRSLESEIYKKNYYMLLHFTKTAEEGIQFAATWNVEGLITFGLHARENEKLQSRCKAPVVSIDVYYEEQRTANVGLDDRGGGYLMAEYLIRCGHKKIGFVSDNDVGVDHERWQGVRLACAEYMPDGEKAKHILIPGEKIRREQYYREHLAELAEEYDALFFASDYYAAEAIAEFQDRGIRVPEDISVSGFDDNENALLCRPKLTTVHQDVAEKGRFAVNKLFDFIQGERDVPMRDQLPVALVIRDSVKNVKCEE